ncbi:MAG: TIGR02450 family Trp-rich protein [Gammaproteobacteria bacterium]|nr:TIGR02450 family Trp-rich protein [Gammaproteobacteria bacterium]MBU1490018.1 TIGR02450 family Trp-rich protein [Gammaproteobacteria bacterium]MBU2064299.1 TIGR02450 family Trp-rich protein [Gammaproteobacteria bacterium]MBU2137935.1 TIGR02450 family Trp-rich protein [Gammaproteobacteria bacterium]MBU2218158.1 TIGR02450 family Trp-rich protein [Gammaproteobacteria bacterium]
MSSAEHKARPARHRINPGKLLLSKWTARQPQHREKHFLVTELYRDEEGEVLAIELQAVLTQRSERLDWRVLQDAQRWRMGWC